jgi:DNA-binding transcriptional regulator YiaG
MDETLFADLVQSLKEAKAIAKGEAPASRHFEVKPIDVKAIREKTGLSQNEFASLIQISTKTLQNWEQRRRTPTGPSAALLKIVSVSPEMALKSLRAA